MGHNIPNKKRITLHIIIFLILNILETRNAFSFLSQGSGEMTEVEPVLDFASSGRSGRRNALPDILGSPAGVSPSDLPLKLAELNLTGLGGSPIHSKPQNNP